MSKWPVKLDFAELQTAAIFPSSRPLNCQFWEGAVRRHRHAATVVGRPPPSIKCTKWTFCVPQFFGALTIFNLFFLRLCFCWCIIRNLISLLNNFPPTRPPHPQLNNVFSLSVIELVYFWWLSNLCLFFALFFPPPATPPPTMRPRPRPSAPTIRNVRPRNAIFVTRATDFFFFWPGQHITLWHTTTQKTKKKKNSAKRTSWRRWPKTRATRPCRGRSRCRSTSSIGQTTRRCGTAQFMVRFTWRKICRSVEKSFPLKPGLLWAPRACVTHCCQCCQRIYVCSFPFLWGADSHFWTLVDFLAAFSVPRNMSPNLCFSNSRSEFCAPPC